jgi:hypothetical protein
MRRFKKNDCELFKALVGSTQELLRQSMSELLNKKYERVITTKDYIVAIGDIPIALVAHMDTVFSAPVKHLYYDEKKNLLWSPEGLGADDRAGIFAIIKIIQSGLRPSIILTTDEERGGLGAAALGEIPCPIKGLKYLIELDRRGQDDCVFYDCDNKDFIKYVESFGFIEQLGTFSDISFLCPAWERCGVNLSVGYQNEHSYNETLHIPTLYNTIEKVKEMLTVDAIPDFEYIEIEYRRWFSSIPNSKLNEYFSVVCARCKDRFNDQDVIPVIGVDGRTKFYCLDCLCGQVQWCCNCGEAYESACQDENLCDDCKGMLGL